VQGSPPTHPELLDHLASTFVASGWDVKHLLRRFVLSATFRQAAGAAPELDPGNELYSVGPSLRLPAEMLRDQVLLDARQLGERIGGASVKPYQPAGLWKEKSGHVYVADQGEGVHRRSLYTIWKRTSPPPAMLILDAAKRDVCVVQRHSTQSPLQVLLFWNDPQYVEAARALAEDLLRSYDDDRVRLSEAFLRLTSRRPHMSEVATLLALLEDLRADYRAAPEDAMAALAVGQRPVPDDLDPIELACWSLLAATLFSHHAVTTLR
ncbi:MAG: DUF1553 domain-containing protein, partial [Planctomycetota bacterium]|nr:DUF1553 domain-containing protein [Planctomycetota bacterium]